MNDIAVTQLSGIQVDMTRQTTLFRQGGHAVYWLGITDETAFRCNTYLICDGDQAVITDPGSRAFFQQVWERVEQIIPPEQVCGLVISHQDPDIAASMVDWLERVPGCDIITSPRTNVLLPHYGTADYSFFDISENGSYQFASGNTLDFIESPFLHFPGAFTTYDSVSKFLFSSDIWAALDIDWQLVASDFDEHTMKMNLFHMDNMAFNLAARGFLRRLEGVDIDAILPQHGSIIDPGHVEEAKNYLNELRCGTDIVYADLED
ncbi:MBL fold metallo-hydrolase [Solemya velesiana gill symbiont]|uniref:MBL fold metallo-hydrolase n=1 Tax=Solemya velesiana gill symbiont TaxID=1918948 RepID=A0A1T2KSX3_9GAMM|nr:MBL fold metallo-hydrolase [Solemya velesiana gill symbiont]OOZ35830.1 MBL fold metallo-hydrolase [Solemya velesiana gill symbiont]